MDSTRAQVCQVQSWKEEEKSKLCYCLSGSGRESWALRHRNCYSGFQAFCCEPSTLVLETLGKISYGSCISLGPKQIEANTGVNAFSVPSGDALSLDAHIVHKFTSLGFCSNVAYW